MNQFEVKLWVNQSEVKETRVEFVIDSSLAQNNNCKIQLKLKETPRDCRLHLLWNKVLTETSSEHSQTFKIERFSKLVNGWIRLTVFAKSYILDFGLRSEHVCDYPGFFSVIVNWNYHFKPSKHLIW